MKEQIGYRVLALTMVLSMLVGLFAGVIPSAVSDANAEVTHDGSRTDAYAVTIAPRLKWGENETVLKWNLSKTGIAYDGQGSSVWREILADHLIKVNNSGANALGTYYVSLTCNNTAFDMSAGAWMLANDEWANYTTSSRTVTASTGTEILNGAYNPYNYSLTYENTPSLNRTIESMVYDPAAGSYTVYEYAKQLNYIPSNSPIVFNRTCGPNEEFYIDLVLIQKHLPPAGVYNFTWTIRAFDGWSSYVDFRDNRSSRAVSTDPVTGYADLTVGNVLNFTLRYSGTHPSDLYLPSAAGTSTVVYSVNNMIIENTGNVPISSVRLDIGASSLRWTNIATSGATTYAAYGNTYVRKIGSTTYDLLGTSTVTYTYSPAIPAASDLITGNLNYREVDFKIVNAALSVGNYSFSSLKVTCKDATGVYSRDGKAYLKYTVYSGTLSIAVSYSSGSSLVWGQINPGSTSQTTTNSAVVTNSATSDYNITRIEIAVAPLLSGANTFSFGEHADLVLTQSSSTYTFPLVSYNTNGINYGRCMIDFGGDAQPTEIAAGSAVSFAITIRSVSASQAPGAYAGTFRIEASANPVDVESGLTGLSTSGIVTQTVTAVASPNPVEINQTVSLSSVLSFPRTSTPWAYLIFKITSADGTTVILRNKLVTDLANAAIAASNATTIVLTVSGDSWVPSTVGDYILTVTQGTTTVTGSVVECGASASTTIRVVAAGAIAAATASTWLGNITTTLTGYYNTLKAGVIAHPYWTAGIALVVALALVTNGAFRRKTGIKFGKRLWGIVLIGALAGMFMLSLADVASATALDTATGYYATARSWVSDFGRDVLQIGTGMSASAFLTEHAWGVGLLVLVVICGLWYAKKKRLIKAWH